MTVLQFEISIIKNNVTCVSVCQDNADYADWCDGWADQSYCTTGQGVDIQFMKENCTRSCGFCNGKKGLVILCPGHMNAAGTQSVVGKYLHVDST